MNRFFSLIVVILIAPLGGCSKPMFQEEVEKIEVKIVDLTSLYSVFESDSFRGIFADPENWVGEVKASIGSGTLSEQQQIIGILGMQKLPKNEYISFVRFVVEQYKLGLVSEKSLRFAVFAGYSWNDLLVVEYRDDPVRGLLEELGKEPKLTEDLLRLVRRIKSGEMLEDYELQKKAGMVHHLPDDFDR